MNIKAKDITLGQKIVHMGVAYEIRGREDDDHGITFYASQLRANQKRYIYFYPDFQVEVAE